MKEKKVLVVIVVRGAKVDIAALIADDAALRAVQTLEKQSHGNAWFGGAVQHISECPCLSQFFTSDAEALSERAVLTVCKRFGTAPIAEIERGCLSTAMAHPHGKLEDKSFAAMSLLASLRTQILPFTGAVMPTPRIIFALLALSILPSVPLIAQNAPAAAPAVAAPKLVPGSIASHPGWPVAKPEDVKSIEAITAAVYDVISGPAGKARDWDRFRSLFVPDARLMPVRVSRPSTDPAAPPQHNDIAPFTVEDYIARSSPAMTAQGFAERGVANRVEAFGNIAHVWSTYESRHSFADAQPFARGINSITLIKDGDRYWIVQILWDSERPGSPIPEKYLAK